MDSTRDSRLEPFTTQSYLLSPGATGQSACNRLQGKSLFAQRQVCDLQPLPCKLRRSLVAYCCSLSS